MFCGEQGVSREGELDPHDEHAVHVVGVDEDGEVIATCRLLMFADAECRLGRMAVAAGRRGEGVGRELLAAADAEALRLGARKVVLHAQTRAEPFYAGSGYAPEGELFMEEGIEHIQMRKPIRRAAVMSAPEIRIDQLTGLRAVLAPGRAERPEAFDRGGVPAAAGSAKCPFCEGREDRTPPEVWAARPGGGEPDTPGWTARAVPNLYPVLGGSGEMTPDDESGLTSTADPLRASARERAPDLFAHRPAAGVHEVIVSAPEHVTSLSQLTEERFAGAVAAWRERMRAHSDAPYLHLIVNEGPDAGASLEHTHAQLYALPFVPVAVARQRERFGAYHEMTMGGHLLSDIAGEEVRRRERLVAIDDEALLVCPWASRSPFELRMIPRRTAPRFEAEDSTGTAMIRTALMALARVFGAAPQLNLWVRTAPRGAEEFGWHVDIVPRLTIRAGFEMGTGVDINVYPPERAAADLRAALE